MADRQFSVGGVESAPADWVLPAALEIIPKMAFASFDGTNAATAFLPCLRIISDSGHVAAEAVATTQVPAGGSADATWFPWWRGVSEAAPAPSPNPLGTVWAWWDFSDPSTLSIDGSGKIAGITDKTNNGHDLSQSSLAHRPSQTTVNGLGAALCSEPAFTYLEGGPWSPGLNVPYTGFAVWTNTAAHATDFFPGATGTIQVIGTGILFQSNQNGNIFVQTNGGSIISTALTAPFSQTLVTAIVNGPSSSIRVNGATSFGTLSPSSLIDEVIGVAHVPDDTPFHAGLTGAVCEVLLYETALSASQMAAVESYLKTKWGTP